MGFVYSRPMRTAGACVLSGNVNTGESLYNRGGTQRAGVWSGALTTNAGIGFGVGLVSSGGHVQFASGAGRLNTIVAHSQMQSGLAVFFYDAVGIVGSGTSVSGQAVVGLLPQTYSPGYASGILSFSQYGVPIVTDMPFYSGLCAAIPSGTPGFTVSFTPESNPQSGAYN